MTELLISGGKVLFPDMSVERADVLVEQSTGTIEAIGDVGPGDDVLDAGGDLVIPGLVNAHTHIAMTLLRGYADDKPLDAWLKEDIWPVEAQLQASDVRAGAELGMVEMIRSGTTAFADMYFFMPEIVEAVEQSGMRALLGYGAITVGKDDKDARQEMRKGLDFAREYDRAASGRVRTAFMPHSLTTARESYLREFVPEARESDLPIHFHANETNDEVAPLVDEYDCRPLEYATDVGLLEPEDFIAHGVHLSDGEIELLADRRSGVVHCPASNMKLASGMAPVQALLEAGVTVGIGTDGAASNNDLDMFDEMRDAAMLGKLAADDASAVDAESAVTMATRNGASILGFDSGRLEPGANADIAVIDLDAPHLTPEHDYVSLLAYAARGSDVRHTVTDGRVLMRDREVTIFDEQRVRRDASECSEDLIDRAT